jgi:hypothetical protein
MNTIDQFDISILLSTKKKPRRLGGGIFYLPPVKSLLLKGMETKNADSRRRRLNELFLWAVIHMRIMK